jgi:hypothetical protein
MPGFLNCSAPGASLRRALVMVLAIAITREADAQTDTYSALASQLPASTRAAGLANAYVAVRDVDVLLSNPAMLVGGRVGVAASAELYGGRGSLVALSNGMTFGPTFAAGIAVQLAHFDAPGGVYPVRPSALTATGPRDGTSAVLAFGGGMLFKGIRFGARAKYINEAAASDRADATVALDVGAAKDFGVYTVGLAVQDVGPSLELGGMDGPLPARVTLGVAGGLNGGWSVGPVDLGFTSAATVRRNGRVVPAAGGEITWSPLDGVGAVGRLGVRYPDSDAGSPITFGATFFLDRLSVDYAFEGWTGEGSAHRIGIRLR